MRKSAGMLSIAAGLAIFVVGGAVAQPSPSNCAAMRPLTVSVSVTPPRVVHTVPYVAKDLGIFAKHCIDAKIVAFEGGVSATALTAIQQGKVVGSLSHIAIGNGLAGKQIWTMAPRLPQLYLVSASIKTAADLKGKHLSASGGGVGGFNWLMGKAVLTHFGLTTDDVKWIPGTNAGNEMALVNGQVNGFAAHMEEVILAQKKAPGLHPLVSLGDLMPDYVYNAYGASDNFIAKNRPLLVDFVASMIEANRAIYRQKDKVIPIIVKYSQFPEDAVLRAWQFQTDNCIWSVNTGIDKKRTEWTVQYSVDTGNLKPGKRPTFEQVVDTSIAEEALKKIGGPVQIGKCKL